MRQQISDDRIRHLTNDALRLYRGFEEIFHPVIVEAVMVHLPPDFPRERVEQVVAEFVPPNA